VREPFLIAGLCVSTLLPVVSAQTSSAGSTTTSRRTQRTPASKSSTTTDPQKAGTSATAAKSQHTPLVTDEQKTIYALGLSIARSLGQFNLSPAEMELVQRALSDSAAGKPAEKLSDWEPRLPELAKTRQRVVSQQVLDKAATQPGATKTASGLIYREVRAGTGASPKATDTVKVNYRGTLADGTEFDSSYARNEPAQFPLNRVVPCWTEGLQLMKAGGSAQLICPSSLAYGEQGRPGIPPGAVLIFDVELLEIVKNAPTPP
jgi:FKBP-type peptidyl-prolyl cis-trans isomerase FkpA